MTPPSEFSQSLDENHVIGGVRNVRLYNDDQGSASVSGGLATFDRVADAVLLFSYGSYGTANDAEHLHLNINNLAFFVTVAEMSEPFDLQFEVDSYDLDVNDEIRHRGGSQQVRITGPGDYMIDFESLNGNHIAEDISGIQISFVGGLADQQTGNRPNGAFSFDEAWIATPVPEPSTYAAVFGLGLLGFAAFRSRARKSGVPKP